MQEFSGLQVSVSAMFLSTFVQHCIGNCSQCLNNNTKVGNYCISSSFLHQGMTDKHTAQFHCIDWKILIAVLGTRQWTMKNEMIWIALQDI